MAPVIPAVAVPAPRVGPVLPGRTAALRHYVNAHHTELHRLAYLLSGDWAAAGELVERALAGAYRHDRLDHRGVLARLVRLATRGHRRRPAPGGTPLWTAVGRLRPAPRAALVLRVYAGLPTAEIAALMGRREATVIRLLDRARTAVAAPRPVPENARKIDWPAAS